MARRVVAFGDSLTQEANCAGGWVQRLAERFTRRADVLNRGFSGYNTRWALELLQNDRLGLAAGPAPDLVTVLIGSNDAASSKQAVPVEEYERNLTQIVNYFQDVLKCKRVVVLAPPPVDEQQYLDLFLKPRAESRGEDVASIALDRKVEFVEKYAAASERVASATGAAFLSLFAIFQRKSEEAGKPVSHFLCDGLHFNTDGNQVVYEEICATIDKAFDGEVTVAPCKFSGKFSNSGSSCPKLPPLGPFWDQIDPDATPGSYLSAHFDKVAASDGPAAKKAKIDE